MGPMASSQNCVVVASLPAADGPPGQSPLQELASFLSADGWEVSEPDLWRDSGWIISVVRPDQRLEVSLATVGPSLVLLQIAPEFSPGPIGRLLRRTPSATLQDVEALAQAVHRFLRSVGHVKQRWCWDGFPADASATPTPQSAPAV